MENQDGQEAPEQDQGPEILAAAEKEAFKAGAEKIVILPVDDIKPYPKNARVHSAEQVQALAKEILRKGYDVFITVDKDHVIIKGHGRWLAIKALGWKTIPVILRDDLTKRQAQAQRIGDNKLSDMGYFDFGVLKDELQDLDLGDLNLSEEVHIAEKTLEALFAPYAAGPVEDEVMDEAAVDSDMGRHQVMVVDVDKIMAHKGNYRSHPPDQIEHLTQSIMERGIYRNIVIANDGTILVGHGVVEACKKLGIKRIQALKLPVGPDDIKAKKLMAADNEISRLANVDDRALTELLKEILDAEGLMGTGYDEKMLANLIYVTRPESEITGKNEAAEWTGMPEYENGEDYIKLIMIFATEDSRKEFLDKNGITVFGRKDGKTWSAKWPNEQKDDLQSLRFTKSEAETTVDKAIVEEGAVS